MTDEQLPKGAVMPVHTAACLAARSMKEQLVAADHPSVLMLAGDEVVMDVALPIGGSDVPLALAELLAPLLQPRSLTYVAEAFLGTVEREEDLPPRGATQQAWEQGDPSIVECIVVSTAHRGGRLQITTMPYHRTPEATIHWLPEQASAEPEGHVADAMRLALLEPRPPEVPEAPELTTYQAIAGYLHAYLGLEAQLCTHTGMIVATDPPDIDTPDPLRPFLLRIRYQP